MKIRGVHGQWSEKYSCCGQEKSGIIPVLGIFQFICAGAQIIQAVTSSGHFPLVLLKAINHNMYVLDVLSVMNTTRAVKYSHPSPWRPSIRWSGNCNLIWILFVVFTVSSPPSSQHRSVKDIIKSYYTPRCPPPISPISCFHINMKGEQHRWTIWT